MFQRQLFHLNHDLAPMLRRGGLLFPDKMHRAGAHRLFDCAEKPHVKCWSCSKLLDCVREKFFCGNCNYVQPPVKCVNYFQYLDFPERYDIQSDEVQQAYRALQRLLHPDKFVTKSDKEQAFSEEQSSMINRAYDTLMKPFNRAKYFLRLHGMDIAEDDMKIDVEFLEEMMDLNEKVASETDNSKLAVMLLDIESLIVQQTDLLTTLFSQGDFSTAREVVSKMQYLVNVQSILAKKLGLE